MNTPAKIARMLGWPEARRHPLGGTNWTPLEPGDLMHPDGTVTHQPPKLRVWRIGGPSWAWAVRYAPPEFHRAGNDHYGTQPTWSQALAVGLAALETASMRSRT